MYCRHCSPLITGQCQRCKISNISQDLNNRIYRLLEAPTQHNMQYGQIQKLKFKFTIHNTFFLLIFIFLEVIHFILHEVMKLIWSGIANQKKSFLDKNLSKKLCILILNYFVKFIFFEVLVIGCLRKKLTTPDELVVSPSPGGGDFPTALLG